MKIRGVYKYNGNIPPPRGGGYQPMLFGKYMKRENRKQRKI
jgi:hypothetical protein